MEGLRNETRQLLRVLRIYSLACFAFVALTMTQPARAQSKGEATEREVVALSSLPYAFVEKFRKSDLNSDYIIGYQAVNPFYLTGDFDGDGEMDYILRLVSKKNKEKEEDAVFFAKGPPRLLSKDIKETYPGPAWYVVPKKEKISPGAVAEEGTEVPKLKGDAIMMVRPESSSALVFWNGKRFELFWQGD